MVNTELDQRIEVAKRAVMAETELMHREFGRARVEHYTLKIFGHFCRVTGACIYQKDQHYGAG